MKLASEAQRDFVADIIGEEPVSDLTSEDAGHIIAAHYAEKKGTRDAHPHEVDAIARARTCQEHDTGPLASTWPRS